MDFSPNHENRIREIFSLFVKLLTFLVGFELTTPDDLLSVDSNTLPLCHGRLHTENGVVIVTKIF